MSSHALFKMSIFYNVKNSKSLPPYTWRNIFFCNGYLNFLKLTHSNIAKLKETKIKILIKLINTLKLFGSLQKHRTSIYLNSSYHIMLSFFTQYISLQRYYKICTVFSLCFTFNVELCLKL